MCDCVLISSHHSQLPDITAIAVFSVHVRYMYIYMDPYATFWEIEQAKLSSAVWKKKNDMNVNAIFLRVLRPYFQVAQVHLTVLNPRIYVCVCVYNSTINKTPAPCCTSTVSSVN